MLIKKCREWAKDGPEGAHFHDHQKSDKDLQDKRENKSYDCSFQLFSMWIVFLQYVIAILLARTV
jgi:hypothetical protein